MPRKSFQLGVVSYKFQYDVMCFWPQWFSKNTCFVERHFQRSTFSQNTTSSTTVPTRSPGFFSRPPDPNWGQYRPSDAHFGSNLLETTKSKVFGPNVLIVSPGKLRVRHSKRQYNMEKLRIRHSKRRPNPEIETQKRKSRNRNTRNTLP